MKRSLCLLAAFAFLFVSGFAPFLNAAQLSAEQSVCAQETPDQEAADAPKSEEHREEEDSHDKTSEDADAEKSGNQDAEKRGDTDAAESNHTGTDETGSPESDGSMSADVIQDNPADSESNADGSTGENDTGDADSKGADATANTVYSYSFQDSTIAVTAEISHDSRFAQDDNQLKNTDVHLEGDTTGSGCFSDLSQNYEGEVRTVDLSFCTRDGSEAEQTRGTIELTMTIPCEGELSTIENVEVYRSISGEQAEQVENISVDAREHTVSFDAGEELGAYAVRYTVDFHYDGAEYSLCGGCTMLLSELFEQLSIDMDAADVEEISFTNDDLVRFTRYDDKVDWVIHSLLPFDTTEYMTMTFSDGSQLCIEVTDDQSYQESSTLEDFMTNWKITVGDVTFSDDTVDNDTVIEYKDRMQYSLELMFAERPELGFATPETDPPAMTWQVPDAFDVPDNLNMTLNVNLGRKGTLSGNTISVFRQTDSNGKEHKYLKLEWNWQDKIHWDFFRDSAQAKLTIKINGQFRNQEPNVLSINGKDVAIRREDLHNAKVFKTGSYDHNGVINYTVTVSSDGTTSDITLTDTLGTALIYQGDIVYVPEESRNSAGTVPQITAKTGNTYNVLIPAMNDGDCLAFHYSAAVDFEGIAVSGNPTFEETGNTAQIFGDSYTLDNAAIYHETDIEFSDLEKNVIGKRTQSVNGNICYILTWEIETNKHAQYPLADTEIKDTIGEAIQSISKYYGSGLTIKCYAQDGSLKETREISWDDLGVDLANDVTWTYHIPDTDPNYRYVLTYDTIVDMGGQTETVVADNIAEGKGGIDTDRAVLPPPGSGGIGISKKATDIGSDHVTWEINLTLKDTAFDYQRMVLTEHSGVKTDSNGKPTWQYNKMPYRWLQIPGQSSEIFKETLTKVEIEGLEGDETFKVNYNGTSFTPDPGSRVLERADGFANKSIRDGDTCSIEFFKDSARTQGNLNRPADADASRSIIIRLTTYFPENWATYARDYMLSASSRDSTIYAHINWISADTPDGSGNLVARAADTDKFSIMPPHVFKSVIANQDVRPEQMSSGKSSTFILDYPNAICRPWNSTETGTLYPDGVPFPAFHYYAVVSGIKYDEPLVLEETFDTSLLEVITAESFRGGDLVMTEGSKAWTHTYFCKVFGMPDFPNWPPGASNANYVFQESYKQFTFGYDNKNWSHKAEDYGCTLEKTDTGFRVTINELFKKEDGSLYPFYGIDYWLIPKNLDCLKRIEEMARANGRATNQPYITLDNTITARGTSASAKVIIGINNDFMPISKTSETYLDLMDGTRTKLQDVDNGNGTTIRDTPDNINTEDIQRYVMKYRVVLNKDRERLNDGNPITAEDEYSSNLSVDFTSINITTDPAEAVSSVSYDYSGNIGYFTIPDETKVVIEYDAVVMENTSGNKNVSNEIRMLQYKKSLDDTIDHGGAGGSSATNPAILVKKYGSGHMEKGLNGAQFQLFEYKHSTYARGDSNTAADWDPVVLTKPDVHNAVFTTGHLSTLEKDYGDGYAEIELRQDNDGATLIPGKVYGLREITLPVGTSTNGDTINYQNPHSDSFYCYIFSISADNETADYNNFVYLPDDTMTIRNTPESLALHMRKELGGNCNLTDAEKNHLTYQVFRKNTPSGSSAPVYMPIMTETTDEQNNHISVVDEHFRNITYSQVSSTGSGVDITGLTVQSGATVGEYLLVEYGNESILADHPDWSWRGTYEWSDGSQGTFSTQTQTVYDENGENPQAVYGIPFTVTSQEIRDAEDKTVTLTNSYSRGTVTLTANKRWASPSGSATAWPSGKKVTFTLGTLGGNGSFTPLTSGDGVRQIQLDNTKDANGEDTAGSAVFKDLPKYNVIGGAKIEVRYAVRETGTVSGYNVVYPVSGVNYAAFGSDTTVTIKNQVVSTSVTASKMWSPGIPENASATFRLYSYIGSDPATATWVSNVNDIVLDGTLDTGEGTFGEKTTPWRADFTGLPQYDSAGQELHYLVRETSCTPTGYEPQQEYVQSGESITNRPACVDFLVRKQWSGTAGNSWPSGERITLSLSRKTKAGGVEDSSFSAQYVLSDSAIVSQDSIPDAYGTVDELGTWTPQTLRVSNLPKYDGNGTEWLYYISETDVTNASGESVFGNYQQEYRDKSNYKTNADYTYSGGSITNIRSVRQLSLTKQVAGNIGDKTKPFRFTISLDSYSGQVNCTHTAQNGADSDSMLTFISGTAEVTLKHNETIVLKNLPGGLQYTVTENADDAAGYQITCQVNGSAQEETNTKSGTLASNPEIVFINTKQMVLPTGVAPSAPIFIGTLPLFAFGWVLLRRRKAEA